MHIRQRIVFATIIIALLAFILIVVYMTDNITEGAQLPSGDSITLQSSDITDISPVSTDESNVTDLIDASTEPTETETPDTAGPDNNPPPTEVTNDDDGFIVYHTDSSDIARGSLILINSANYYSPPEDTGFVFIGELKTPHYRVSAPDMLLSGMAIDPLNEMMEAFYDHSGLDNVIVRSAFRDNDSQQQVLDEYIRDVGKTEALKWASPPGYSEHQTGLAVDFGIYRNGAIERFDGAGTYTWFAQNCHKYGFILRYPQNKTTVTKTAYEPWHFRYVGHPHASMIKNKNWCLEEFHQFIHEYSWVDPYKTEIDDTLYAVYFTYNTTIRIPEQYGYMISGTNVDGYIVTYITGPDE